VKIAAILNGYVQCYTVKNNTWAHTQ